MWTQSLAQAVEQLSRIHHLSLILSHPDDAVFFRISAMKIQTMEMFLELTFTCLRLMCVLQFGTLGLGDVKQNEEERIGKLPEM